MAIYSTLSTGSSGDQVKKLQQALSGAGYDLGSSGADGLYGVKTAAAVKQYQLDNGLTADGVAGSQTLDALYGSQPLSSAPAVSASPATEDGAPDVPSPYSQYTYDPTGNAEYQQALSALQQAQQAAPTYAPTYAQQLDALYQQIMNREDFTYDVNADALYQQYKDYYLKHGQLAMADTLGQAAALTGGYDNSYAQNAAQQAYQGYLQELNNVVPELYAQAADRYDRQGRDLMDRYALTGELANTEYDRYLDQLNQYWQNLDYLQGRADSAYDRGAQNWYNAYKMGVDADDAAYRKQLENYDRLVTMMTTLGYQPSAEEIAAAGLTEAQAQAFMNYYAKQNSPRGIRYITVAPDAQPSQPQANYSQISSDVMNSLQNGASRKEIADYLQAAKKDGSITDTQYQTIMDKVSAAKAGQTYYGVNSALTVNK